MFVGHYAAAFAAKAAEPKAPLWTLAAACQLVDIGWGALLMAGVERATLDPSLPGYPAVLEYMPYTHSLPGALLWALGATVLAMLLLRLSWKVSVLIGAVVFSHWLLDLLVHRPDLELWFGGEKVGFALWNHPVLEQAIELGLLAVTGAWWAASRAKAGGAAWPALALITFYVALQIAAMLTPLSNTPVSMGGSALVVYLIATVAAALADGKPKAQA